MNDVSISFLIVSFIMLLWTNLLFIFGLESKFTKICKNLLQICFKIIENRFWILF